MKNYKKTVMIADNLEIDDHLKIAGLLYRISQIHPIGNAYTICLYNVRRPKFESVLTLATNTLVHVWNQK